MLDEPGFVGVSAQQQLMFNANTSASNNDKNLVRFINKRPLFLNVFCLNYRN